MQNKPKLDPVICGIDIGSWSVKIGCYDGSKFDILTNEANFRETPSLVAFTPAERMIGESANTKLKTNFQNTIRSPMRLIGLGKNSHIIQQQLKYSTVNYELQQSISFLVKQSQTQFKMQPEQLLMALMFKIKQIVSHNKFSIYSSYIAVPSYLTNSERLSVKKCAQIMKLGQVHLVDDWVAVASEYFYFRLKELQILQSQRDVVFIDIGYSKLSVYAVRFTRDYCQLLDFQHLKYTGSKNMDNCMIQFYDELFLKQTNQQRIITNPKALIKLKQMIEKERKVLSANTQHHMNIQYLLNDHDLSYNMKRQQFQNIIMPVLSDMATVLSNIKNRVEPKVELNLNEQRGLTVQLLGGASRIPLVQKIVSNIFNIEPSKTLNSSEAMARGASIYGAIDIGFVSQPYQIYTQNFCAVSVVWNPVKNEKYLGQNPKNYLNKKMLFDYGSKYPCQSALNLGPQGVTQVLIFYQHELTSQSIGYIRINTPNKIVFIYDKDKIISAKCLVGGFLIYNFHEIKEEKWIQMKKIQKQMQQNDNKIHQLYQMKNHYESLIYKLKDKISTDWIKISTKQEQENILHMLLQSQKWIEIENQKPLHSDKDINQYNQRIESLDIIIEMMRNRQINYDQIEPEYRSFVNQSKSKAIKNQHLRSKIEQIIREIDFLYTKMQQNQFQTRELTVEMIKEASMRVGQL